MKKIINKRPHALPSATKKPARFTLCNQHLLLEPINEEQNKDEH